MSIISELSPLSVGVELITVVVVCETVDGISEGAIDCSGKSDSLVLEIGASLGIVVAVMSVDVSLTISMVVVSGGGSVDEKCTVECLI